MNSIEVREIKEGEEKEIINLLNVVFGKWPRFKVDNVEDFLKWKITDNPLKLSKTIVALDEDRIIGLQNIFSYRLKIGKNSYNGFQGLDTAINKNYRKRGVFNSIEEYTEKYCKERNISIRNRISTNPILIERNKRMGYPLFPNQLVNFIKIFDMKNFLSKKDLKSSFTTRFGYYILLTVNKFLNSFKSKINDDLEAEIVEVDSFDRDIDVFWDKIKNSYDFIIEKKYDYINWRYNKKINKYTIKLAKKKENIVGYIVYKILCPNSD